MTATITELNPYNQTLHQVLNGYRYESELVVTSDGYEETGELAWAKVGEYGLGDYTDSHIHTGSEWIEHTLWNSLTTEQVAEMKSAEAARLLSRRDEIRILASPSATLTGTRSLGRHRSETWFLGDDAA